MSKETRRIRWHYRQVGSLFWLCLVIVLFALEEFIRAGYNQDLDYQAGAKDALMVFGMLTCLLGGIFFFQRKNLRQHEAEDRASKEEPDDEELDEDDL